MITFLRKIRYTLIGTNNTKYFKYAIGEIILVVLGILIALQINIWNEDRKDKIALDNIFETIQNDLYNDIEEGKAIVLKFKKMHLIMLKCLVEQSQKKNLMNVIVIMYLLVSKICISTLEDMTC
jgi:hypothetical protein